MRLRKFRGVLFATIVIAGLSPALSVAQVVPPTEAEAVKPPTQEASVVRSSMRATSYKIGTAALNLTLLSYALGSVAGGGVLAAGTAVTSWLVYTANDYGWDYFSPAPAKTGDDQAFDKSASAWRTTMKYLTFKPLGMGQKFLWLYAYTGSVSTMMTWGAVTAGANTVWFYANEMAWDWYDWNAATAPAASKSVPAVLGAR